MVTYAQKCIYCLTDTYPYGQLPNYLPFSVVLSTLLYKKIPNFVSYDPTPTLPNVSYCPMDSYLTCYPIDLYIVYVFLF